MFRRVAARRPDAIALADAPNRQAFTDGPPLRLSYAEADRMISAIAGRLRRMGLATDAIVGIQMPNIVENILTVLGVLRAGLIAAPLPLLWRRADAVTALARVGAKALIACRRVGSFEHCQFAARVAAEVFSIRYVCGFGANLPDGVVPLDDLFSAAKLDPVPPLAREANAAAHLAVISFEVGEDGPVPVARRHLEFLAGGLGVLLESRIEQDASVLSTVAPASFAGICLTLVPWLLTGGTLALHHPFDADILARQRHDHRCGTLILPAAAAYCLAETGLFAREGPTTVVAAWPAPDRLATSAEWRERDAVMVDVPIFGEAGLLAARRGAGGRPAPIPFGAVIAPRDGQENGHDGVTVAELAATATDTLTLRGPMVPRHPFPPGHRTLRSAVFRHRTRRFGRYRLRLPRRSGRQDHRGHRSAVRHRQCRLLSLPALHASGNDRPHRRRRCARGPARSAVGPLPHRHCIRSRSDASRARRAWRQSAGHRRLRRARRAGLARSNCRGVNGAAAFRKAMLTAH